MKKNTSWSPLLISLLLVIGLYIGYRLRERLPLSQGFFQTSQPTAVQEVMDLIRMRYVDPVSPDSLSEEAIRAILARLDPHSIYIPAGYLQELNEDLQGNFEGIGVEFQIIRDTVHVVTVLPGGPSAKAGLQVGDRFLQVGEEKVAGAAISSQKIRSLLRGPGQSLVRVHLLREGTVKIVDIERGRIPLYAVDAAYMLNDTTGFIRLNKFSSTSYEELMQALEKLKGEGMRKLILDLRGNGGGILAEAVDIADEFLPENLLIVYTQGDKLPRTEYRCKRPGLFEEGELVILVDEGSASASEVLAGAMQDWNRGLVIGRRTFGKGLVQEQLELSNGAAIRLTVARYFTPSGRSIQKSYAEGSDAYHGEVAARFENGEQLRSDSLWRADSSLFEIVDGRAVYTGGGILPDIFVPYDTTGLRPSVASLFSSAAFATFIYEYYLERKSFFSQYENAAQFAAEYQPGEDAWQALSRSMKAQGHPLPMLDAADREEVHRRIRAWMARQLFGAQAYFQLRNQWDQTVQRALGPLPVPVSPR